MNPQTTSALRTIMKIGGTFAATAGALSAADVATITNLAEVFFGAAFALWGAVWSAWSKRPKSVEAKAIAVTVVEDKLPETQAAGVVAKIEAPAK